MVKNLSTFEGKNFLKCGCGKKYQVCTKVKHANITQVEEKQGKISWHVSDQLKKSDIEVTLVQVAAAEGKMEYLQILLDHG